MELDFSRPPKCPEALEFADWAARKMGELPENPSQPDLDQLLLSMLKEYLHRTNRIKHTHSGRYGCLGAAFVEKATELYETQLQMLRLMSFTPPASPPKEERPPEEPKQELYIGEELDENG